MTLSPVFKQVTVKIVDVVYKTIDGEDLASVHSAVCRQAYGKVSIIEHLRDRACECLLVICDHE